MYGKGVHFDTVQKAAAAAGKIGKDPVLLAARDKAAFDLLRRNSHA